MKLNLTRPLCIFDLETTGTNITKDRIVEIAIIKIDTNGKEENYHRRVNPTISIPDEIVAIHGISNKDVQNEPTFSEIAGEVISFIADSDLGGYNSNKFDIPVLAEELMRAEVDFDMSNRNFVDVQNIFHRMEQRTLAAAYQFYCDRQLENAHSALFDARATWEVFKSQLERYPDLKNDIPQLAEFSKGSQYNLIDFAGRLASNEKGQAMYNFGKHKGKTLEEVMAKEPGYYGWMLDADFPLYTKQCLRREMEKIKAKRAEAKEQQANQMADKISALKDKFNHK